MTALEPIKRRVARHEIKAAFGLSRRPGEKVAHVTGEPFVKPIDLRPSRQKVGKVRLKLDGLAACMWIPCGQHEAQHTTSSAEIDEITVGRRQKPRQQNGVQAEAVATGRLKNRDPPPQERVAGHLGCGAAGGVGRVSPVLAAQCPTGNERLRSGCPRPLRRRACGPRRDWFPRRSRPRHAPLP